MRRIPDRISPARGIIIGLLASLPLWALLGWSLDYAMSHSHHVTLADQENFSSYRTANGGVR